jgi:hypothetical protein
MRKLATIQRVDSISLIKGADRIVCITVKGWELVAKKNEFKVGDKCIFFETDSVLPDHPVFEFMRRSKFRVKTIKLRGQISQGLAMPVDILEHFTTHKVDLSIGQDVTDIIGVVKYEPHVRQQASKSPKSNKRSGIFNFFMRFKVFRAIRSRLVGDATGTFPPEIPKTDEERIQNLPYIGELAAGTECYVTEKLDGQSGTFAFYKPKGWFSRPKFIVASRNKARPIEDDTNYWNIARSYELRKRLEQLSTLLGESVAVQGEIVGPRVQKNNYKFNKLKFFVFNIFKINSMEYVVFPDIVNLCDKVGLQTVPIINTKLVLAKNMDTAYFLNLADSKSTLVPTVLQEGIVVRSRAVTKKKQYNVSFKAISREYLLSLDE